MSKHYIMAAGGSGALALESLIHLFAAGYSDISEVTISIVDPDETNHNVERVTELINIYKSVRESIGDRETRFFRTKINYEPGNFWNPNSDLEKSLDDGILYTQLEKEGKTEYKLLTDLLFTEDQRVEQLDKGYKGNPMIGTIFMKKIENSHFFTDMRHEPEISFFMFGSLFGGTGASGLPVMGETLKTLRKDKSTVTGACITLPYFSIKQPLGDKEQKLRKDRVNIRPDSSNFLPAVKFAIPFYINAVNGKRDNGYNAIYFVGSPDSYKDSLREFAIGGREQDNKSHFVNLYSATSYLDFIKNMNNYSTGSDSQIFASAADYEGWLNYENLPAILNEKENRRIEKFYLTSIFFRDYFLRTSRNELTKIPWITDKREGLGLEESFYNDDFIRNFDRYARMFLRYIGQLYYNRVPMRLFKTNYYEPKEDMIKDKIEPTDIGDYYEHVAMEFGIFKGGSKNDLKDINKYFVKVDKNKAKIRGDKSSWASDFLNWMDEGMGIYINEYSKKHTRNK